MERDFSKEERGTLTDEGMDPSATSSGSRTSAVPSPHQLGLNGCVIVAVLTNDEDRLGEGESVSMPC